MFKVNCDRKNSFKGRKRTEKSHKQYMRAVWRTCQRERGASVWNINTMYSLLCAFRVSESSEGRCVDMTAVLLINQDNTSTGHTLRDLSTVHIFTHVTHTYTHRYTQRCTTEEKCPLSHTHTHWLHPAFTLTSKGNNHTCEACDIFVLAFKMADNLI